MSVCDATLYYVSKLLWRTCCCSSRSQLEVIFTAKVISHLLSYIIVYLKFIRSLYSIINKKKLIVRFFCERKTELDLIKSVLRNSIRIWRSCGKVSGAWVELLPRKSDKPNKKSTKIIYSRNRQVCMDLGFFFFFFSNVINLKVY